MASNPMQRQKRISFWLGVIVTLLICSLIIAALGYILLNKIKSEIELKNSMKTVQVLKTEVKSGQIVTANMIGPLEVSSNIIPSNAYGDATMFSNLALQTKDGYQVSAKMKETIENNVRKNVVDYYYIEKNGKEVKLEENENGEYVIGDEVVELKTVPLIAKVNMKPNTILTRELVSQSDEVNTDDARIQEYNMVTLPTTLETGDFVDIRLRLPNGTDYIVVSKKEVNIPDVSGVPSVDTIDVNLSEEEILTMSNAIVEAYIMNGSELYAAKYTDPGNQKKSTSTYPVGKETMDLINSNPNIVETAKKALWARYNTDQRNGNINNQLSHYTEEQTESVESNIETQIQKQKELREKYLQALNGGETN